MATLTTSQFARYNLSDNEILIGSILNQEQIYAIQNLICTAAEEKLALKFDPSSPHIFLQREAELQGQIGILQYLLELSRTTQASLSQSSQEF